MTAFHLKTEQAEPSLFRTGQISAPVTADGFFIRDNGGDAIANCAHPRVADHIANLINANAGI